MLRAITFDFWMTLYQDPKGALKFKRDEARPALLEALEVGIEMGGGPAMVSARFTLDVMEDVFGTHATA